jgi:hypothetical protein
LVFLFLFVIIELQMLDALMKTDWSIKFG